MNNQSYKDFTLNCSPELTNDYFCPIFDDHWYKTLFMTITFISIPINTALLSGIIWYERYGIEAKRTIVNKLFSSGCWTAIQFICLIIIPDLVRYSSGPWPDTICWLQLIVKNSIGSQFVLILTATIVMRYICIFLLNNPTGFQDDFWSLFLNIWIVAFSFITQFVFVYMPGRQTNQYYICLGKSPPENLYNLPPKTNFPLLIILLLGSVVHVLISIKIFLFKNYVRQQDLATIHKFILNKIYIASLEKHSMTDFTTNTCGIISFLETLFLLKKIGTLKPHELNVYPNNLILNWLQLGNFAIAIFATLVFYYGRKHSLRSSVVKKLKDLFQNIWSERRN